MGNPEHLEWLLEGVAAWNARRQRDDFLPDLSGMDIRAAFETAGKLEEGRIPLLMADLWEADLTEADLGQADLGRADLTGAHLREAKLLEADLRKASLRHADLEESALCGAVFEGTDFGDAILNQTIVRTAYGALPPPLITDLSRAQNLTQIQVDTMRGDTGTILPEGLHHPAHWPDPRPPGSPGRESEPDATSTAPRSSSSIRAKVQERPVFELRHALQASYPETAVLAEYIVGQLQNEIAAHRMTAIPNDAEALSVYNAKLNFLNETLIAVQRLHEAIPVAEPDQKVTPEEARRIKDILLDIARQVDKAIRHLDSDTGTYGNFWKIGLIGACSGLLNCFGIPVNLGAPIAAGVIGVSTFRFIVDRRRGP
ncbi:hypothetical protein BYZ73_09655 [Rhodovulum viride]|uniref:Pentapeptide repeat protein n=1 Tax=Rhodovulum viride TaxID=1231134 RepID=A0ABX9DGM4_9RHOB|nr:pentapeptide repeat-containing protein [Rhodovulum viride]RAP41521.1 hypothetical protein BYZ73_09655 [Rhodovulum viride]